MKRMANRHPIRAKPVGKAKWPKSARRSCARSPVQPGTARLLLQAGDPPAAAYAARRAGRPPDR